jgi:hypothetical protein
MPEPKPETKPEPAPDAAASTPEPDEPKPATQEPMAASTVEAPAPKVDGWDVDPYQLRSFTDAVMRARSYLEAVRAKVDRMQGAELTPQLGTSPVGQQLAKKFDDRLNSQDGLRARLAEAMKRMDNFVTSAEKVARTYEEPDQEGVDRYGSYSAEVGGPPGTN